MRIGAAALKAGVGLVALSWATMVAGATGAGTSAAVPGSQAVSPTSSTVPSINIISHKQPDLAGACSGGAFDVKTVINIGTQASADVRLSAPGVGILEEFTDETGKNIGPFSAKYPTFHIPNFGGGLAPNTPITLTITTYSGPGLSGQVTFTSSITFNCSTGAIIRGQAGPNPNPAPIPALTTEMLLALIALSGLLGAMALRRRARVHPKS